MQLPIELSHPCYHDEDAARVQLESIRWPNGPYCPICGSFDRVKPLRREGNGTGLVLVHAMPPQIHGAGRFDLRAQPHPDS